MTAQTNTTGAGLEHCRDVLSKSPVSYHVLGPRVQISTRCSPHEPARHYDSHPFSILYTQVKSCSFVSSSKFHSSLGCPISMRLLSGVGYSKRVHSISTVCGRPNAFQL